LVLLIALNSPKLDNGSRLDDAATFVSRRASDYAVVMFVFLIDHLPVFVIMVTVSSWLFPWFGL
jgi:hypothetical protein